MAVLPSGVGTWIWWGTAILVAVAVVRHVFAARGLGRRPSPLAILGALAVPIFLAALARSNSPWLLLALALVSICGAAWAWSRREENEVELGPYGYEVDMSAELINAPYSFCLPSARGHVRVTVDEGMISISSRGLPGWADSLGMLNHTFRATDCEVDRPLMGVSSFFAGRGEPSIVLRGTDSQGAIELALSEPTAVEFEWQQPTVEDVQRQLIVGGARPAGDPVGQPPGRLGTLLQPDPPARPET
jgi:hypothetical protein